MIPGKVDNVVLNVVGVTFKNEDGGDRQVLISKIPDGDMSISLRREPWNSHDSNAIAVYYGHHRVGYIGREYVKILAPIMDSGRSLKASVNDVGQYNGTWYLKIKVNEEV